jgi:hypothetical protein
VPNKQQPHGAGQLGLRGALLKMSPQVAKIVTIANFGDRDSGALSKRELSFRRFHADAAVPARSLIGALSKGL